MLSTEPTREPPENGEEEKRLKEYSSMCMNAIKQGRLLIYLPLAAMCEKIKKGLKECNMHSLPLGDYGAIVIAGEVLHSKHLTTLNLGLCSIGPVGISQLAVGLRYCTSLRELILGGRKRNRIEVKGHPVTDTANVVQKVAICGAAVHVAAYAAPFVIKALPVLTSINPVFLAADLAVGVVATVVKHSGPKSHYEWEDSKEKSHLEMSNNLGGLGTEAIGNLLLDIDLERLDLSFCGLDKGAMSSFVKNDTKRETLKWLSLKGNDEINSSSCKFRGTLKVEY
jgi:hypothetical protein